MPLGCTSKCQPLEFCIDKPFKGVLCNCWEDYVADIVTNLSEEEQNSEKFKRPSPSRQAIVNWVAEVFSYLHHLKKVGNDKFWEAQWRMSMKKFMKKKKGYLQNVTKIHSTICNLVACVPFSRTSLYYDNINYLFFPPYLIVPSQGVGETFLLNIFLFLIKCAPFQKNIFSWT